MTYSDVEGLNSLEEAIWLIDHVARAAGVLAAVLLEDDTLIDTTGSPQSLHLLLIQPVDHDIALDLVEVALRVAVLVCWSNGCWARPTRRSGAWGGSRSNGILLLLADFRSSVDRLLLLSLGRLDVGEETHCACDELSSLDFRVRSGWCVCSGT